MGEKSGFAKYPKPGVDIGGKIPQCHEMTLLAEIEKFCAEAGLSESQFGTLALNDKNFIPQLREGRDVRLSTVERVRAFIAAQEKAA